MSTKAGVVCNVFSESLKSNSVFELFILIWIYEGLKMSDFGGEKGNEKFSITPIFDIFITAPLCTWHEMSCVGLWEKTWSYTIRQMCSYTVKLWLVLSLLEKVMKSTVFSLSLLVSMYWSEIFCVKAVNLSVCMHVMAFVDQHTLLTARILWDRIKYIAFTSREREYWLWGGCTGPERNGYYY